MKPKSTIMLPLAWGCGESVQATVIRYGLAVHQSALGIGYAVSDIQTGAMVGPPEPSVRRAVLRAYMRLRSVALPGETPGQTLRRARERHADRAQFRGMAS